MHGPERPALRHRAPRPVAWAEDARANEAVVVYQAMLVSAGGKSVTQRRFEVREPITGAIEAKPVGEALTRAANKVAVDVAGWLGS